MADFHIISAAFILLFTLLPKGSFSTQTTGKVYEKRTIPARALDGVDIFKTIHKVTKIRCGVICSQYEDRCNAMQLLYIKSRKGTCQLFHIDVHCITFDSTLSVDELATIYISTDHSAKYRPENQLHTSCAAIHADDSNMASGVYNINLAGNNCKQVYCNMSTDGGNWTVIQRRQDGSVQFNQTWEEYRNGFGSPHGELWIGNTALHQLTANQPCELRIDIGDWQDQHIYAVYSTFHVASEADNFTLTVGEYSGTAGDGMRRNDNQAFSTTDRDHDTHSGFNCAAGYGGGGGWWYWSCGWSNLNGRYIPGGVIDQTGVYWYDWRDTWYSYKTASMMTRPKQ